MTLLIAWILIDHFDMWAGWYWLTGFAWFASAIWTVRVAKAVSARDKTVRSSLDKFNAQFSEEIGNLSARLSKQLERQDERFSFQIDRLYERYSRQLD